MYINIICAYLIIKLILFFLLLDNNIVNELIENGLVSLKPVKSNNPTPDVQALIDLQNKAKAAKAGKWDPNAKV